MKRLKYSLVFLVFLTAWMTNCNDEKFLEEDPFTFYTIDNAFSTSTQIDQALITLYQQVRATWTSNAGELVVFKGKGTDMYDVASIRKGGSFSNYGVINPDNSIFYDHYSRWYNIIAGANMVVYAAELPQIKWASGEEKAYVLAQARFFRAFAYRNLAELFGGVPIVTEVTTSPRYDYERASRIETYRFAIDEMEAIENDLPETTKSGGRLVRAAAQHNLCELYLALGIQLEAEGSGGAQAEYTKSVGYAGKVIDGGFYSLVNSRFGTRAKEELVIIDVYTNGTFSPANKADTLQLVPNYYWDLFQEGNVNYQDGNPECIWAAQIDYEAFKAEDAGSVLNYSRHYGPDFRDGPNAHIRGMLEDVGGRGIVNVIPTMYTRDLIYEGKWAEDMRNSEIVFRRRIKGNVPSSPYYLKPVPWEVIYEGSSDPATNMNYRSLCFPISCKITTDRYTGLDEGQNRSNLFRDDYIIRLPETILLRAEAKQRLGDKAGAAADINLLRARAQCGYLVTAADMDDQFGLILDERARELVYEECRWNTLLRMGGAIAVDRIRRYAYWPETEATLTFHYNLWPIPQKVIDLNKNMVIEQNPGWTGR